MKLAEFYDLLVAHDWWWEYADNHSDYQAGKAAEEGISLVKDGSIVHERLYSDYRNYAFGTPRCKKPERPE